MALNAEVLLCYGEEEESDYYLQFSRNKITFEGVSKSKLTNVFFDESNSQVFSIKSGDVTEVTVKSPDPNFCKTFRIEEKGRVISIKFSPDQSILSLQRTENVVEFLVFNDGNVYKEFIETFKGCTLLGYIWTGKTEVVFVTDNGVRICKVDVNSGLISTVKNLSLTINWFNYYSPICLILLSTGANSMQLLQIKQNQILKLTKFDVDCDSGVNKLKKHAIAERDVALGVVYNQPRILLMNHQTISTRVQTEVIVYTIIKLAAVKKTNVLRIHQSGRFALNLVDNLIIVHNQFMKSSLVFDITDSEFQGVVSYHVPVIEPKTIKPFEEDEEETGASSCTSPMKYELYSSVWIMFQPNIVMDAKAGCLWTLELNLMGFYKFINDRKELIKFLLLRSNSKSIIARTLTSLMDGGGSRLEDLAQIFDQINIVYRNYLEQNIKSQISLSSSMSKPDDDPVVEFRAVIDQYFIYTNVFCIKAERVYNEENKKQSRLLSWTLLEYIRSLADLQIPAQHFLYELLINCLVLTGSFYQLHQLLQYHGVADSKPLAYLLLSLENVYPAAPQLALDMLERLGKTANEEISEILLSRDQVLPSLRYATSHAGPHHNILPHKYLEVAKQVDDTLYRSLLKYFESKPFYRNGT